MSEVQSKPQTDAVEATSPVESEFLATMGHEIRTPMNGVLGMTELLLDSGLTETQRRYAENIQSSGEALLHSLSAIIDFSKIEAGKLPPDTVDFEVRRTTEEVVALMVARARAKGLELDCRIDDAVTGAVTIQLKPIGAPSRPAAAPAPVRAPLRRVAPQPARPPVSSARRVLLIEDNRVNQEVAKAMLRSLGYEVDIQPDGKAGSDAAIKGGYDLVLMDCQMPEMDGYQATGVIRTHEAKHAESSGCTRLPIVALTANAMKGDRERCLASGMDDYLAKPFRKEQLSEVLSYWLDASGRT